MTSTRSSDKWFLVQWSCGGQSVVNLKSLISPANEAVVGSVVIADKGNGNHEAACIIASSRDRQQLEAQLQSKQEPKPEEPPEPAVNQDDYEPGDFSASGSSWAPSDEKLSSDDGEVEKKKIKTERFSQRSYGNRRTSKILKPSHRVEAINVMFAKNRKRTIADTKGKENIHKNMANRKSVPDQIGKNNMPTPAPNSKTGIVTIDVRDIMDMKQCFHEIFKLIKEIKTPILNNEPNEITDEADHNAAEQTINPVVNDTLNEDYNNVHDASDRSRSEDLNRSDDNVLITNKYQTKNKVHDNSNKNVLVIKNEKIVMQDQKNEQSKWRPIENDQSEWRPIENDQSEWRPIENDQSEWRPIENDQSEWIPIGSGKTLIHKDVYKNVKWKSYTIATRTLLLAVFPRRILATHSLTGKRSPAFQDKPAKMCLDPKLVSDVIIEITDRFNVKENLVRSIITTKCADESKMYKLRQKRKSLPVKRERNQGNVTEPMENIDEFNQTY